MRRSKLPGTFNVNLVQVRKEMLRALRGRRSQSSMSRRLGYASNRMHAWETGHASLKWDEFESICRLCKADLAKAIETAFRLKPESCGWHDLVITFAGKIREDVLARKLGVSQKTARRWLKGEQEPQVEDLLAMMFFFSSRFLAFMQALGILERVPALAEIRILHERARKMHSDIPECPLVHACLESVSYAASPVHLDGFVAHALGKSLEWEHETLRHMTEAGLLASEEGKYVPYFNRVDMIGIPFEDALRIRKHWLAVACEALRTRERLVHAEHIFLPDDDELSRKYLQELLLFYNAFVGEASRLVPGMNVAHLLNIESFSLEDPSEPVWQMAADSLHQTSQRTAEPELVERVIEKFRNFLPPGEGRLGWQRLLALPEASRHLDWLCREVMGYGGALTDRAEFLSALFRGQRAGVIAAVAGGDRTRVSRWRSGSVELELRDVLRIVSEFHGSLREFLVRLESSGPDGASSRHWRDSLTCGEFAMRALEGISGPVDSNRMSFGYNVMSSSSAVESVLKAKCEDYFARLREIADKVPAGTRHKLVRLQLTRVAVLE